MEVAAAGARDRVEQVLWPLLEEFMASHDSAGLAVAVVCEGEVISRCFGVRDLSSGAPVTPETMFHLASVSKPFVATAVVSMASTRGSREPVLDLDAPIVEWIPEFTLADGRQGEVTARRLLSHTSGLPDVTDYGWHDPQLGDDALSELARSLSGWRLQAEPGSAFSYSNAGFELLGLLLSRVAGTTFEDAVRQEVLIPFGMRASTFLRSEVPRHRAAAPHVGMPLAVPAGAYPYTRRHAPSSSLHSNVVELCRWMVAHLEQAGRSPGGPDDTPARLDPSMVDLMWHPVVTVGRPPWEEAAALGWSVGSYHRLRTLSHSGADPGFGSKLVLVPERRSGVVVLANSNTVPTSAVAAAALDVLLSEDLRQQETSRCCGELGEGLAAVRSSLRTIAGRVAEVLADSGAAAARAEFHRSAAMKPAQLDLDDEGFVDAVWGAIELHRTDIVWPLLRLWAEVRPEASAAWAMTGWAHLVDGQAGTAREALSRALDLDPENDEAASLMGALGPT